MLFSSWGNLHSACIAMLSFQGWGDKLQDFVESIWPIRKGSREWPLFAHTGRLESTYCGHSRPRPWTPRLGGLRSFPGCRLRRARLGCDDGLLGLHRRASARRGARLSPVSATGQHSQAGTMAGLLFGICAIRPGSIFSVSATMSLGLCASQLDRSTSSNRSALKTSMYTRSVFPIFST